MQMVQSFLKQFGIIIHHSLPGDNPFSCARSLTQLSLCFARMILRSVRNAIFPIMIKSHIMQWRKGVFLLFLQSRVRQVERKQ